MKHFTFDVACKWLRKAEYIRDMDQIFFKLVLPSMQGQDLGDLNHKTDNRLLDLALKTRAWKMAELLVQSSQIDINSTGSEGMNALYLTIHYKHESPYRDHHQFYHDLMRMILDSTDVRLNLTDKSGRTPLIRSVELRDIEIVEILLAAQDIDVNIIDKSGHTALSRAIENDQDRIVDMLCSSGKIDLGAKDEDGSTMVDRAIANSRKREIEWLWNACYTHSPDAAFVSLPPEDLGKLKKYLEMSRRQEQDASNTNQAPRGDPNHALLDYEMRRRLFELQKKKQQQMARQEQDTTRDDEGKRPRTHEEQDPSSTDQPPPQTGNAALQDYQRQLMLVEQQNKKTLPIALQEPTASSTAQTPPQLKKYALQHHEVEQILLARQNEERMRRANREPELDPPDWEDEALQAGYAQLKRVEKENRERVGMHTISETRAFERLIARLASKSH